MTGLAIAVVGGGPRAVHALERLAAHGVRESPTVRVTVFEPHRDLGAGSAYEADLPGWARLNLRADAVDVGLPAADGPARLVPSFDDWRRAQGLDDGDQYPPRALAGRYLTEMAGRLAAPWGDRLRQVREQVLALEPDPRGGPAWRVRTNRATHGVFDEVLVVTGHAPTWAGRLPERVGGVAVVPALPLPSLRARAGGPVREVLVRGAALTAIDATLAFTVGQGPGDPARITWWSRTGRLMEAKPDAAVQDRLRAALPAEGPSARADGRPLDALVREAASLIAGPGVDEEWARLTAPVTSADETRDVTAAALRRLENSIAIAAGERPPDARWALGEAWRWLYSEVVGRAGRHSDRHPAGWEGYRAMAPELERLAFGPPLVNARIIRAQLASGQIRVLAGGALEEAVRSVAPDALVDAVLAPPGLHRGVALWPELAARGLARTPAGSRGIEVDGQARVIGADGAAVRGLSAAGRITEDFVIGNDTLTRTLHPGLDGWGARMAALSVEVLVAQGRNGNG